MFEALGRGLVVEPLAEAVVLAGRLFALHALPELRDAWIEGLLSGERRIALAHAETSARDGDDQVTTTARSAGTGLTLTGSKPFCIAGAGADGFIVSARLSPAPARGQEVALFFVPADAEGLTIRDWRVADGSVAAALTFDGVTVPADNRLSGGLEAIAEVDVLACVARCAEALGVSERLFADTLEYLRTREQFGALIGTNQVIQHRMVEQYVTIEQSRALLNSALVAWGTGRFAEAAYAARAFIAEVSVTLGHEMIQFHGGMGVTDELAVGAGHKRLLVLSRWPEGPTAALDRYAAMMT